MSKSMVTGLKRTYHYRSMTFIADKQSLKAKYIKQNKQLNFEIVLIILEPLLLVNESNDKFETKLNVAITSKIYSY